MLVLRQLWASGGTRPAPGRSQSHSSRSVSDNNCSSIISARHNCTPGSKQPRSAQLLLFPGSFTPSTHCSVSASGNGVSTSGSGADAATAQQPRRGVVVLPGLGNATGDYAAMAAELQRRGLEVEVAAVNRVDWLRNGAGLANPAYWRGTLQPLPTVSWYMARVRAAVEAVQARTAQRPVTLLAHSAGGWMARVYLLEFGTTGIDRLVTLGSPHQPPPPGVIDQTRGILTHVAASTPGTFHEEVAYVTVAGKYIRGAPLRGEGSLAQKAVGAGYATQCGAADVWGDGIVPLDCAHLDGAEQITLEGVSHSPLGSNESGRGPPWYGSPSIINQWIHTVVCNASELADYKVEVGELADDTLLAEGETVGDLVDSSSSSH